MMAATLVSRALGFLKAMLLVAAIGGTSEAIGGQTFEIANSAPTYLFALIAGGVLGVLSHDVGDTRLMGVVPMPVWMRSVL